MLPAHRPKESPRYALLRTMRFIVVEPLLRQLRAWRGERHRIDAQKRMPWCPSCDEREREARERIDAIEVEFDAVYLHGIPHLSLLTADGRLLVLEREGEGLAPVREASDHEAFRAIAYAAQIAEADVPELRGVVGLLDLLPEAPGNATPCPYCEGSRDVRASDCSSCNGLGWTILPSTDSERVTKAIVAFIRSLRR